MVEPSLAALIVDQSPDAVIFAGKDGAIQAWNAAAAEMFGYSAGDAMGKSLDIIIPEQFREAHWKGFDRAVETGVAKLKGQALPTRAHKASGEVFYVELSFSIIRDAAGQVIGASAHARDINERFQQDRASRRRLRELEAELKELRPAPEEATEAAS